MQDRLPIAHRRHFETLDEQFVGGEVVVQFVKLFIAKGPFPTKIARLQDSKESSGIVLPSLRASRGWWDGLDSERMSG